MTPSEVWTWYNHTFPVTQFVLSMRVLEMSSHVFRCPCGQEFHAAKQITEDDEIVVCPRCQDWHLVSWRIAA